MLAMWTPFFKENHFAPEAKSTVWALVLPSPDCVTQACPASFSVPLFSHLWSTVPPSPTLPSLGLSLGNSCELGSYRNLTGAISEGFMEEVMWLDLFRRTSPASQEPDESICTGSFLCTPLSALLSFLSLKRGWKTKLQGEVGSPTLQDV